MPHDRGVSEPSGLRPDEPRPDLPASYPPRSASPGHLLGRAEGVGIRVEAHGSESSSETVLSFRLTDPLSGQPTEVELRGRSLAGTVQNGDWVEVESRPTRSGRLEPLVVANLTTRSEVRAVGGSPSPLGRVLAVVFVLVFLAVLAVVVVGFITTFRGTGF